MASTLINSNDPSYVAALSRVESVWRYKQKRVIFFILSRGLVPTAYFDMKNKQIRSFFCSGIFSRLYRTMFTFEGMVFEDLVHWSKAVASDRAPWSSHFFSSIKNHREWRHFTVGFRVLSFRHNFNKSISKSLESVKTLLRSKTPDIGSRNCSVFPHGRISFFR